MEVLKFNLRGLGAVFTRPYVNSIYLTYNHIHKIALLGLMGAVIGIEKDHNKTKQGFPTFYEKLNNIEVSIVPKLDVFPIKTNRITETSGMFNKNGTNYVAIYNELVRPSWDIYIINRNKNKYFDTIKDNILNNKSIYLPYLGKNHFHATISNVSICDGKEVNYQDVENIDSLFVSDNIDLIEIDKVDRVYYEEYLPVELNNITNHYIEKRVLFTNNKVNITTEMKNLLMCDNRILYFV